MINSPKPLITIIVLTYNSGETVLETLNSIKTQNYRNIELIITDDQSCDKTIEICNNWLKINGNRFVNSKVITSDKNTGVTANCNRGIKAVNGEWVKLIAGDDILVDNCIGRNYETAFCNPEADIFFSDMIGFNTNKRPKQEKLLKPFFFETWNNDMSAEIQYKVLLKSFIGNAPTFFIKSEIFKNIGFDETIPFMDDYPFALNATKMGYRFYYFDEITVYYRNGNSITNSLKHFYTNFYIKEEKFRRIFIYPNVPSVIRNYYKYEFYRKRILDCCGLNNVNFFTRIINKLTILMNPFAKRFRNSQVF